MWDVNNWSPLCKMHHSQKTGKERVRREKDGFEVDNARFAKR